MQFYDESRRPRCLIQYIKPIGYRRFGGTKASAEELGAMFSAMEQNGLLKPARVLTGKALR